MRIKKQITSIDCGLCVVEAMHHFYFHKGINLDELRKVANITDHGMSIQSLIDLGAKYGIIVEAFNAPFTAIDQIQDEPMIAIIENEGMTHYVILIKKNNVYQIYDSAKGKYRLSQDDFEKIYRGMVLTLSRSKKQSTSKPVQSIWMLLGKNPHLIIWNLACLLIGITFAFASTLFSKVIFDQVIPGQLHETLKMLVIAFGFMAILRVLNSWLRSLLSRKLELHVEYDLTSVFVSKVKNGDLKMLHKFSKQEFLRRYFLISPTSAFVASALFLIVNEVVVFVISVALLFWISSSLFVVALLFGAIVGVTTYIFQLFLRPKYETIINNQMLHFTSVNDLLSDMNACKEDNFYQYLKSNYDNSFMHYKQSDYSTWKLISWQKVIIELVSLLAPIVLTYWSVKMIFESKITTGLMVMFLGIFNTFIAPLIQLCVFALSYHQSKRNAEQIMAIISIDNEVDNVNGLKLEKIETVKIEKLKFGFDKQIININHLLIDENIHITGRNGIGKSTLLNIIAYRYQSDALHFNNIEAAYYSNQSIRNAIYLSSINQELPSDKIINQIMLGNTSALLRFNQNLEKYQLHILLKKLNINLEMKAISGGNNLSSGQRQIVKLLRLFAFDWKLIILDEAFENIDHDSFVFLANAIAAEYKDTIFIETSHSKRFVMSSKEVSFESINQSE